MNFKRLLIIFTLLLAYQSTAIGSEYSEEIEQATVEKKDIDPKKAEQKELFDQFYSSALKLKSSGPIKESYFKRSVSSDEQTLLDAYKKLEDIYKTKATQLIGLWGINIKAIEDRLMPETKKIDVRQHPIIPSQTLVKTVPKAGQVSPPSAAGKPVAKASATPIASKEIQPTIQVPKNKRMNKFIEAFTVFSKDKTKTKEVKTAYYGLRPDEKVVAKKILFEAKLYPQFFGIKLGD